MLSYLVISVINAVINGINSALGWLGVHINNIAKMAPISEMNVDLQSQINAKLEAVNGLIDDYRQRAEELYNEQIGSLKKLLSLGLISENEYQTRVGNLNEQMSQIRGDENSAQVQKLTSIADILEKIRELQEAKNQLESGNYVSVPGIDSKTVESAPAIAKTVQPATQPVVNVTVQGSVVTNEELADVVERSVRRGYRRGSLEYD